MTRTPLQRLGRYRIVRELGQGAMGVVYLADDELLQRPVALKTMRLPDDAEERTHLEGRFRQEAKAAGGLNHPHIVTVHDLGREGDWLYIAMELLQGPELRELILAGGPPLEQALELGAQVALGLATAHERGIVHRDVKPANIMVMPGPHAKIMDFGVARMQASEVKTQTGLMLGSPKYMSPEQVEGRPLDHRSDIFSLGAILYEMAAGRPPFEAPELANLLFAIVRTEPPAPSQFNPAVPPELDRIVARALSKDVRGRYQDARELARDLQQCRAALNDRPGGRADPPVVPVPALSESDRYAATQPQAAARAVQAAAGRGMALSPHFDSTAALDRIGAGRTGDAGRWGWAAAAGAALLGAAWLALA
jgi:serine/threonine protein kinase